MFRNNCKNTTLTLTNYRAIFIMTLTLKRGAIWSNYSHGSDGLCGWGSYRGKAIFNNRN